jgi:hypothetical protein
MCRSRYGGGGDFAGADGEECLGLLAEHRHQLAVSVGPKGQQLSTGRGAESLLEHIARAFPGVEHADLPDELKTGAGASCRRTNWTP